MLTTTQASNTSPSFLNTTCWQLATSENATQITYPADGVVVYSILWSWFVNTPSCLQNAPSNLTITADFILVLTSFALPAVIFSTVIPRRWRLDMPERFLTVDRNRIRNIAKLFLSIPAICLVATVDMIGWIICIMTFAGPMAFSGVQEMLLDFRVVKFLERNPKTPARETLETIVALLCGNYDQDPDDPTSRINSSLIPSQPTETSLQGATTRLVTILNSQTSFGATIGIPAVFFLGGFWYNASQGNPPRGAVSYGIFLIVLVIVTIISGTLLAGNSPHTVSVLLATPHIKRSSSYGGILSDVYDSELHPVAMWDRGFSKYQWLQNTTMWHQRGTFHQAIRMGGWSWVAVTMASWLLVATPCCLSLSFDYLAPWPWFGSLSLLYTTYLVAQTWLILMALVFACLDMPLCTIWQPSKLLSKGTSRPMLSRFFLLILTASTGAATFAAAVCTIFGSSFHFSDGYGDLLIWLVPVADWVKPTSERWLFLYHDLTTQSYEDYIDTLILYLPLGAVLWTCAICFFGWWYHQALRIALKDVIGKIEE